MKMFNILPAFLEGFHCGKNVFSACKNAKIKTIPQDVRI